MIGTNIKRYRELRNYTQEYMAKQLNISQNAYSKIEANQTKVDVERLQKLAEILEVGEMDLMREPNIVNLYNNQLIHNGYVHSIKNDYQDFAEKLLKPQHELIALMRDEMQEMRKERQKLIEILDKMAG